MDKAGLTLDDISQNSEQLLSTLNIDDAASQARKEFLEGQGIRPTRAQITGDPNAFQAQSELVGQSGKVSNALKQQEKILEVDLRMPSPLQVEPLTHHQAQLLTL